VATRTAANVSDPDLVLDAGWTNVFTVFHLPIGMGILIDIIRLRSRLSSLPLAPLLGREGGLWAPNARSHQFGGAPAG
jgi:hypothetical protein